MLEKFVYQIEVVLVSRVSSLRVWVWCAKQSSKLICSQRASFWFICCYGCTTQSASQMSTWVRAHWLIFFCLMVYNIRFINVCLSLRILIYALLLMRYMISFTDLHLSCIFLIHLVLFDSIKNKIHEFHVTLNILHFGLPISVFVHSFDP